MGRKVPVPFLKSVVLLDVVKIVSSDNNCTLHFHTLDNPRQNTTADTHISSEGTLLVNIRAINCLVSTGVMEGIKMER